MTRFRRDELVIEEPKVTGPTGMDPVRVRYKGNIRLAKEYLGYGKKQLGLMRMSYAVGDRVSHGQEGMYWSRRVQLQDGTVVTTTYNERLQEIVIESPHRQYGEEKKEREDVVMHPYLWVGARINWEATGATSEGELWNGMWSYSMWVSEPNDDGDPQGAGVLTDHGTPWNNPWAQRGTIVPGTYVPVLWSDPSEFDIGTQLFRANLYYLDNDGTTYHYMPNLPGGWTQDRYAFAVTENIQGSPSLTGVLYATQHGGRMYDMRWWTNDPVDAFQYTLPPYDPKNPVYADSGYVLPNDVLESLQASVWTSVYVIDPTEGSAMLMDNNGAPTIVNQPTSPRPQDPRLLDLVLGELGGSRQSMHTRGSYAIKLVGVGSPCVCDTDPPTLYVDLEVRSGKAPFTNVYKTTVPLTNYSYDANVVYPFGLYDIFGGIGPGNGPGVMCENWWQGAIIADAWGGIEEVEYFQPDYLPGGSTCAVPCDSIPVRFLVSWCGFSSVNNWLNLEGCSTVAECVGEALAYAIDYYDDASYYPLCSQAAAPSDAATLSAGWLSVVGTISTYDFAAAIYDPYTQAWSRPTSNCVQSCWLPNTDGCVEQYVGAPAFQGTVYDGIAWMMMVPGVYCGLGGFWYTGVTCE